MRNIRNFRSLGAMTSLGAVGRLILMLTFFMVMVGHACQVPVFRYALERWEPAPYLLRVTPGPRGLTTKEKTLLESQYNSSEPANLEIEIAPPGEKSELALFFPHKLREVSHQPIWQVDLTEENIFGVIDSPIRRELRRRLLGGQTAIWVLLTSGNSGKDEAAASTLQESSRLAQEKLKLPEGVITQEEASRSSRSKKHENADALHSDLALRIEFSVLRLDRTNAEEIAMIRMLTKLEPDLESYLEEPMVFPVFGRGRALEPMIGKGIHPDNIMETAGYLCGACSCEIKDQNPGVDLLLAANWDSVDNAPKIETVRMEPAAPETSSNLENAFGSIWKFAIVATALILVACSLFRKPPSE